MISQVLIAASLAAFVVAIPTEKPSSLTVDKCPTNLQRDEFLKTFGEKCYWFMRFYATDHDNAAQECNKTGGALVTIKSAAVNDFIQNTLAGEFFLDDAHVWIGLSYDASEGKFVWSDGTPLMTGYNNMAKQLRKVETFDAACGVMYTKTGKWQVVECMEDNFFNDEFHGYICEYEPSDKSVGVKNPNSGR